MEEIKYQRCIKGLWDTSIPNISFENEGISNYYRMFKKLEGEFPKGEIGKRKWEETLRRIKNEGKNKKYDCIIGVSGGTDSSYLLHLAKKEWNLKPLAVNLDNGWSSEIAVSNIKKITRALEIDLETYVIDYEKVKAALRAYMKATLPWIDGPTDMAIKSTLYRIATREKIKNILVGTDFRSEGKQPNEWTYNDSKLFNHVVKKYEGCNLRSFPNMSLYEFIFKSSFLRIKKYQPFYHIEYQKKMAQELLSNEYSWEYYGGHHHENLFTKFAIAIWQYYKFGIDKRIITFSAQVVSGEKERDEAIQELKQPPYDTEQMKRDKMLVIKKLGLSQQEFEEIWNKQNNSFHTYPSHYPFLLRNKNIIRKYSHLIMPSKPKMIVIDD